MMKFVDLTTDVLALKCFENHVFIGIGCTLYVVNEKSKKIIIKRDILHPDNIHGIIFKQDNNLIIFGGKSLCICQININYDDVSIESLSEIHRFDDWIIDVKWLGDINDGKLTILFAHNNVYNYDLSSKTYCNISCEETCLLYAGEVSGENFGNAVILSGTVFQEILIWKAMPDCIQSSFSDILHRLKGHKGVIFSVFYDPHNKLICSTSDDRTVRLWKVFNECESNSNNLNWKNAEIQLQTTMYGHLARVWRAVLLNNIIASIGEDSRICFWSLTGELLHKIEAHQGAAIWCIGMSEDGIVYTGGADGSVNCWSCTSIKSCTQHYELLGDEKVSVPKHVMFLENTDVLIYLSLKNSAKIAHYKKSTHELINFYELPEYYSTYCIMELAPNKENIALASIKGEIILYKKENNSWFQSGIYKIVDSKIFSVQWLGNDEILISASEGNLNIIKFLDNGMKVLSQHILPSSRERWVTAACVHKNHLLCGDRMGSIFVYNLQSDSKDPIQIFKKMHGRLGVQSCTIVDNNLVTTGRDGTLKFYKFATNKSEFIEYLYAKNMPMDWVSRLIKNQDNHYVLGFKEDDFVIYSILLRRILVKFPCGGGHRSWDCTIHKNIINFVYIQKRKVHVLIVPLKDLFIAPLMVGFHTKEIYTVKSLPVSSKNFNILISGGEDCTLFIHHFDSKISESKLNLKIVNTFDGHLSSIKCLSIFALSTDKASSKYLIFSGGGRAQLKVWEMAVKNNEKFSKNDISCKDLLSYMLHGPDKERNKIWIGKELMYNADPETRYMDISTISHPQKKDIIIVFIACSDGYLRTFNYNFHLNEIKLINTVSYKNKCILKVHSFKCEEKIFIMTMATDGLLNFWSFAINQEGENLQKILINDQESFVLHQSGINSFDMKTLDDFKYLLVTGGDDNLLSLIVFRIFFLGEDDVEFVKIISTWKTASAHYAQITGVKLLENKKLVSVGADQKLIIHNYSISNMNISVAYLKEITLCISDIQGITFCDRPKIDDELFCCFGKGFQLLQL